VKNKSIGGEIPIYCEKLKDSKIKDMLKICPKFNRVPVAYHLPFYEIEKLLKFLQISFGNHKNSGT
jgi:hypothetical protein